ncbi:MAG: winged helix-turn-helix domain-containing protein [Candidatus Bathyarchaeota archaeon]|jgi:predicted transcriptional regulator
MTRYRDRLQIVADILVITSKRAKKTRIMYQANLSYKLLCKYLEEVVTTGLVSRKDGECYLLTDKGEDFLKRYEKYSDRCKNLKEHLNHINNERKTLENMCSVGTTRGSNNNPIADSKG